jgi:hypothetical protein
VLVAGLPVFMQQVAVADRALLASHVCIILEVLALAWVQEEAAAASASSPDALLRPDEEQLSTLLKALHGRVYVASDAITALVSLARLAPRKLCTTRQLLPEMLNLLQRQGTWWQQALVMQQLAAAVEESSSAPAAMPDEEGSGDLSSLLQPPLQQALLGCVTRVIDHTHTHGLGLHPADDWEEWNRGHQQAVVAAVKGYCKLLGGIGQAGVDQLERPLVDYIMGHLLGVTGKLPLHLQPVAWDADAPGTRSKASCIDNQQQQQQDFPGPLYMLCTMAVADPGIWPHDSFVPLNEQNGDEVVRKVAQQAGEMLGELLALPGDLGVMVARQVLPALPLGSNVKLAVVEEMVRVYWKASGVGVEAGVQEGARRSGSAGSSGVLALKLFVLDAEVGTGFKTKAEMSSSIDSSSSGSTNGVSGVQLSGAGHALAALLGRVGDLVPLQLLLAPLGYDEGTDSEQLVKELQMELLLSAEPAGTLSDAAPHAEATAEVPGRTGWERLLQVILEHQAAAKVLLKVDEGVLGIWWSLFEWPKEYKAPAAAEGWDGKGLWLHQLTR